MPKLFYLLLAFFGFLAGKIPADKAPLTDPFAGYTELLRSEGDLDADGQTDRIIVYEKDCGDEKDTPSNLSRCRRMAIFLKRDGDLKLFGYNDFLIACSDCANAGAHDPFQGLRCGKGFFEVDTYEGECHKVYQTYRFRHDAASADFLLQTLKTEEYICEDPEDPNSNTTHTESTETEKDFGTVRFLRFGF
ncbi:MAG: hypothetical protein ACT6QS_02735 [Flavobacteriales bacterium]